MGQLHLNSSQIMRYNIEIVETGDHAYILVNIVTENESLTYKVVTDNSFNDIKYIHDRLQSGISAAVNNVNENLYIGEFLERQYVFFGYPDGTQDKYTAFRVDE